MNLDRDGFQSALLRRLDRLEAAGRRVSFWWRDDDAVAETPALRRLLDLSEAYGVPICLAVIPRDAQQGLAEALSRRELAWVSQHGWAHDNHQPVGEKAAELGDGRPADVVIEELSRGRARLEGLFPSRFRPVLTPPWNRISEEVAARRGEAGLSGLSTFARLHADDPVCRNAHLDPIAWKRGRGFVGYDRMLGLLDEELVLERGPIGLLTHHLAHDDGVWAFTESFVAVTASHRAARWAGPEELFGGT